MAHLHVRFDAAIFNCVLGHITLSQSSENAAQGKLNRTSLYNTQMYSQRAALKKVKYNNFLIQLLFCFVLIFPQCLKIHFSSLKVQVFVVNSLQWHYKWKGINRKQSTRWQHLSRLKASAFFSLQIFFSCYKTQQLILGTGIAIWWLTEPHCHTFSLAPPVISCNIKNVLFHWETYYSLTHLQFSKLKTQGKIALQNRTCK